MSYRCIVSCARFKTMIINNNNNNKNSVYRYLKKYIFYNAELLKKIKKNKRSLIIDD